MLGMDRRGGDDARMTAGLQDGLRFFTTEDRYRGHRELPKMNINEINARSGQVVDAAMKVHSALGPGLLKACMKRAQVYELQSEDSTYLPNFFFPSCG